MPRFGLNAIVVAPVNDGSTVMTGSTCDWKLPSAPAVPAGAEEQGPLIAGEHLLVDVVRAAAVRMLAADKRQVA